MEERNFFILTETEGKEIKALLSDLDMERAKKVNCSFYTGLRSKEEIDPILKHLISKPLPFLLFQLSSDKLALYIKNFCSLHDLAYLDLNAWLLTGLRMTNGGFNKERLYAPAGRQVFDFAHTYDDGKDPGGIKDADICLIGISRTGKTPLSMYLASRGLRTVNIPLLPEAPVPKQLYKFPAKRIFGLTAASKRLSELRHERLKSLGLPLNSPYAGKDRIEVELNYAHLIMKEIGCPIIDISHRAVEEIADIIIKTLKE